MLLSIAGLLMYVDIFSCLIAQKMKEEKRMEILCEILCEIVLSTLLFWVFHILWFSFDWLMRIWRKIKREGTYLCVQYCFCL